MLLEEAVSYAKRASLIEDRSEEGPISGD